MNFTSRYFLREVAQSFKRNILLNLSSVSTVMVLIFQLGFFIFLVGNINYFSEYAMEKLQMTVVLIPDYPLEKAGQLKFRIMKHPDVSIARYMSKEKALESMRERMGGVGMQDIGKNPLPDTLIVEFKNPEKIREVSEEIKSYPGVSDIRIGKVEVIDQLINLSYRIYLMGVVIIGMLLVSAVFLISNTIRLTVFSRRREIEIMELVGANQWFIRGPFIVEGLIQGLLGAGIAVIILNSVYFYGVQWLNEGLPFMPLLPPGAILFSMSLSLLGAGALVGVAASYFSVNKYLKI